MSRAAAARVRSGRPGGDTLAVLVGGAAGALMWVAVAEALPVTRGGWPWATFSVNLAGAFLLGWVTAVLAGRGGAARRWRLLVGTGFCGALTTFSAFQLETLRLAQDGCSGLAAAYATASLALGLACAVAGAAVARAAVSRRGRER